MAEQTQIQQVTMKDQKKVEVGKRMAESNRRKREELKAWRERKAKLTYFDTRAIVPMRVLGVIGYYIYQSKTPKETPVIKLMKLRFADPRKLQLINLIWISLQNE